jgi:hypothetical protein
VISDHKGYRLYREMMREAVSLGDWYLIEKVLMRINRLAQPTTVDSKSNVLRLPIEPIALSSGSKKQQKLWVTVLLTAMIPMGINLLLMALYYVTLGFCSIPCQR